MATVQPLTFGQLLKRHRVAAGLTQEALAERSRLAIRTISDLERGLHRAPYRDTIERLADALQLSASERARFEAAAHRAALPVAHSLSSPPIPHPLSAAPTLVGRIRELALLERHLAGESTPLLLLAGEPGMGKTRLLREAATYARAAGWTVLEGGCQRRAAREPYAPLVDALAQHIARQSRARLRVDLLGCAWLIRLLPELAELSVVPAPQWILPPEQERRLMFAAVGRLLANVAGPAGTLLVLDDLQWAGTDALDLLSALAQLEPERPVRIVGAYRENEVRPDDPLDLLLIDLARDGLAEQLALGPLTHEQATELLENILADIPISGVALREQVLRRAGGVPFFLVSCARGMTTTSSVDRKATQHIPWDVRQSIRQRVAAVSEAAREIMGVAAIVGRHVNYRLLAALAAGLMYEPREVIRALAATDQARLLIEREEHGEAQYQFTHDLIREVVLADLGAAQRQRLHGLVAYTVEARLSERERQQRATELAWYFAGAGEEARAFPYELIAGDQAESAYAHMEAAEHYQAAVLLARALDDRAREAQALEKLGAVLAPAERARPVVEQTVEVYRTIGDVAGEARAVKLLGNVLAYHGKSAEGIACLRALLERFPSGELAPNVAASLYKSLADLYHNLRQYDKGLKAAEQATESARAAGDTRLLLFAEWRYGMELWASGHIDAGGQTLERVIPDAEAAGEIVLLVATLANLAWIHCSQGTFDTGWRYLKRAQALIEPTGNVMEHNFVDRNRGVYAFLLGRWEEAQTDWERARARQALIGPYMEAIYPPLFLGILCMARGQWQTASEYLDPAIAQATSTGDYQALRWAHAALAERELLDGRPDLARARLELLLDGPGQQEPDVTRILPVFAWAHLDMGNEAHARSLVKQCAMRAAGQHLRIALVDTLRIEALMALRRHDWGEAMHALDESLGLCRAMPYPYAEAKALYVSGQLEMVRGKLGRARERYTAALRILERLGERLYAEHVERALAELE